MMCRHMQFQVLRHCYFATQVTNQGGMGMLNVRINSLLRTSNVMAIFMGAIDTVCFVRPFMKLSLSTIGKCFTTDFAIMIM